LTRFRCWFILNSDDKDGIEVGVHPAES